MSGESDSEEKLPSDEEVVATETGVAAGAKDPAQAANPGPRKLRRRTGTLTKKASDHSGGRDACVFCLGSCAADGVARAVQKVPRKKGSIRRGEVRRISSSNERDVVMSQLAVQFPHVSHARLDEVVTQSYKGDGNTDACVAALQQLPVRRNMFVSHKARW